MQCRVCRHYQSSSEVVLVAILTSRVTVLDIQTRVKKKTNLIYTPYSTTHAYAPPSYLTYSSYTHFSPFFTFAPYCQELNSASPLLSFGCGLPIHLLSNLSIRIHSCSSWLARTRSPLAAASRRFLRPDSPARPRTPAMRLVHLKLCKY